MAYSLLSDWHGTNDIHDAPEYLKQLYKAHRFTSTAIVIDHILRCSGHAICRGFNALNMGLFGKVPHTVTTTNDFTYRVIGPITRANGGRTQHFDHSKVKAVLALECRSKHTAITITPSLLNDDTELVCIFQGVSYTTNSLNLSKAFVETITLVKSDTLYTPQNFRTMHDALIGAPPSDEDETKYPFGTH